MMGRKLCFYGEIWLIIPKLSLLPFLSGALMILLFQLKILRNVVWMVAMATECCRMSEGGCSEGIMVLQCDKTGTFIHEIARRITSKYNL